MACIVAVGLVRVETALAKGSLRLPASVTAEKEIESLSLNVPIYNTPFGVMFGWSLDTGSIKDPIDRATIVT